MTAETCASRWPSIGAPRQIQDSATAAAGHVPGPHVADDPGHVPDPRVADDPVPGQEEIAGADHLPDLGLVPGVTSVNGQDPATTENPDLGPR